MSRWLLHYSVPAVLVRLCALGFILFSVCHHILVFASSSAEPPSLNYLPMALPAWTIISVLVLLIYFSTQQDLAVNKDEDDRRRQKALRADCIVAVAVTSSLSLGALLMVIHWEDVCARLPPLEDLLRYKPAVVATYQNMIQKYIGS